MNKKEKNFKWNTGRKKNIKLNYTHQKQTKKKKYFIQRNGAHGNRVSPNCARFDLNEKERKQKIKWKLKKEKWKTGKIKD